MTAPTLHTVILPNGKPHTRNTKRVCKFAVMVTYTTEYLTEMRETISSTMWDAHNRGEWLGGIEGWSNVRKNAERTAANLSRMYRCPVTVVELAETPQGGLHVDLTPSVEDLSVETIVEETTEATTEVKAPSAKFMDAATNLLSGGEWDGDTMTLTPAHIAAAGFSPVYHKQGRGWGKRYGAGQAVRFMGLSVRTTGKGDQFRLILSK